MVRELADVEGIIFKRKKYKEADILCKILTKDRGIFTLNVRGALRAKSKLGAATLNFTHGIYTVNTSGKGISSLRTFKNVKQFESIYSDLTKQAYASYLLDLIDHAFVEYQPLGPVYDLAKVALEKINAGEDEEIIKQIVELKMLKSFGVEPKLNGCLVCNKQQGIFDFSIEKGGIVCQEHFNLIPQRMHLNPKTVALIRTLGLIDINRLGNIHVNDQLKKSSQKVIDRIYSSYLDLNLKSKKFLDELKLI